MRPRAPLAALAPLLACIACLACVALPAVARADGDPGSDELVAQNLFTGSLNVSAAQQLKLGRLLDATDTAGAPVRVAIIATPADLGTVTPLWRKPQLYANYLGTELSLTYTGRLLIVMPTGLGVYWHANSGGAAELAARLSSLRPQSSTPTALVATTEAAVDRIELSAGVAGSSLARLSSGNGSSSNEGVRDDASTPAAITSPSAKARPKAAAKHHGAPTGWFLVMLIVIAILYVGWRAGRFGKLRGVVGGLRLRGRLKGVRLRPIALLPTALLLIVVAALVVNHLDSGSAGGASPASNANLDPGTQLKPKPAPNFTLTDERGRPVSLSQYRGRAVILAFIDAECQTLCPLTTEAMLDAKRSLGAAGRDVQLLGINVNWKSKQIDDVLNYTEAHGLTGQWHFLTSSSLPRLERIWKAYGVNERALIADDTNNIDHVAAVYVIGPQGRVRKLYTTQSSYAAIPQFGQELAHDVSDVLPGHPGVNSNYSYAQVRGITPSQSHRLPREGGGHVALGPGRAHLYLFFATWDTQTTAIAAELAQLNGYARAARAHGLPPLTAIDEGSVEPSRAALPAFLRTVPQRLDYPVAIDSSGRVADGYQVEGEPWFVLVSRTGQIVWGQEVYTAGWPTLSRLERDVRAALSEAPRIPTSSSVARRDLAGSPAVLAALHRQGSELMPGGAKALFTRIAYLRRQGYTVVVNIWASNCVPCQKEFGLFATASALYGKRVAFLGADNEDAAGYARAFMRAHPVSYPSYQTRTPDLSLLIPGGIEGTPTTVFIPPTGKGLYWHTGQYLSQGSLDADIEDYALGAAG